MLLGLITSTYSTLIASSGAAPLAARDVAVDWMVVGTIPLRAAAIDSPPSWESIFAGILTHQAADFGWALVFFGLLGRWTRDAGPGSLVGAALPWAALTSAFEYYVLLPHWQPLFVLEQPYWVGLSVHITSAVGYPLFPFLRARVGPDRDLHGRTFALLWVAFLAALAGAVIVAAATHSLRLDPLWPWGNQLAHEDQRRFLRRMTAHHEVGARLASYAAQRGSDSPRAELVAVSLRDLGKLMHAAQESELRIMNAFWRSFYGGDVPQLQEHEHKAMPGMISTRTSVALAEMPAGPAYDRTFLDVMIDHHRGAITMADEGWARMSDPRLKALANSIAHAQRGQITIMDDLLRRIAAMPASEGRRD